MALINCDECKQPCNCVFADDGIVEVQGNYVVNTGQGRRTTVLTGQGTVNNPYTVSFIDSEFYRPNAGEVLYPDQQIESQAGPDGYQRVGFDPGGGIIVYQSPGSVILSIGVGSLGPTVAGFFFIAGASVEWESNNSFERNMFLLARDTGGNDIVISGSGGQVDGSWIMTASGFWPGDFITSGANIPGYSGFAIYVQQNSGVTLNLSNIKFWVVTL